MFNRVAVRFTKSVCIGQISRTEEWAGETYCGAKINGKRSRGRSPTRWVNQTKEMTSHGVQEC